MIYPEEFTDETALRDLGVRHWRGVTSDGLTRNAAAQSARLLSDTICRQYEGSSIESPFLHADIQDVLGHSLVHVRWETTENEDHLLAEDIRKATGIECGAVFSAARMLLKATGHMQDADGRELTIFQTTSEHSNGLHRDGEHRPDFIPREDLVRYMLHLRGYRQLTFADSGTVGENVATLALAPGDAYGFMPDATYHGAEYDDLSLAIYVQTD